MLLRIDLGTEYSCNVLINCQTVKEPMWCKKLACKYIFRVSDLIMERVIGMHVGSVFVLWHDLYKLHGKLLPQLYFSDWYLYSLVV